MAAGQLLSSMPCAHLLEVQMRQHQPRCPDAMPLIFPAAAAKAESGNRIRRVSNAELTMICAPSTMLRTRLSIAHTRSRLSFLYDSGVRRDGDIA
jgi:hypothetical protein